MAFMGLFIGIDRYTSLGIEWLSYYGRDAIAMCAITKPVEIGSQLAAKAAAL
jgi:hypothetical protein